MPAQGWSQPKADQPWAGAKILGGKKIILFDFDGVLVDSYAISYKASQKPGSFLTHEQYRQLFEGNIYDGIEQNGEKNFRSAKDFFADYISELLAITPVLKMKEIVEKFGAIYQLVVVSSTPSDLIQNYLNDRDLAQYFDWILGADVHTNKTIKIQMVLDKYNAKPQDCVFITDTLGDMREAAKCKVQSIGVTWGFHEKERLAKGDFFALVDKAEDLPAIVESFFKSK